jgi:hydrogenase expression/formation protein HypE
MTESARIAEAPARRRLSFSSPRIDMTHGAGGKATHKLIEGLLLPALDNPALAPLADSARIPWGDSWLALTTDAFVVRPLSFPGGSIGDLAINGTVNDLAVCGAVPIGISSALIIEEGLPSEVLEREMRAMAAAAQRAGVNVVTGDTKVVERGKCDGLYIVTAGVGRIDGNLALSPESVRPGDQVLISGTLGDHGAAILIARGELELEADVLSDTRPLTRLAQALAAAVGPNLRFMRDPTRGGAATVLNELARDAGCGITIREDRLPVREVVNGACEILGIDPLYVANEGKLIAVVAPEAADAALAAMRSLPEGEEAAIIGEAFAEPARMVLMYTRLGGRRMIDMLVGDPLPRIC